MKKVGISTVYKGYNYGSALQAFATKKILAKLGYTGEIINVSGSLVKGRDVRLKKLFVMALRTMAHPVISKRSVKAYSSSISQQYSDETKQLFEAFFNDYIKADSFSMRTLTKIAKSQEYGAFICGSDQIWNSGAVYVDPQYYLRYAPEHKRIAFASSFGRDFVPEYNKKKIKKYISQIPYLSAREKSGTDIINNLTGKTAPCLLDPTLVLSGQVWEETFGLNDFKPNKEYVLAYFLNEPTEKAGDFIKRLAKENRCEIIALPYDREKADWFDKAESAGPIEFLKFVKNAKFVCTDSFHGTAFSINLKTPFYTFERDYGNAENQSTRVASLLELVDMEERFNPIEPLLSDFTKCEEVLERERKKALEYLKKSLNSIEALNE